LQQCYFFFFLLFLEGYISSKDLKENIEKAWATLHLQGTAAAFLTASLASRMTEPVNTTPTTLPTQGGSSAAENPSTSSNQSTGTSGASGFANPTDSVAQPPRSTSRDVCFLPFHRILSSHLRIALCILSLLCATGNSQHK
jgi:hypothetical protein